MLFGPGYVGPGGCVYEHCAAAAGCSAAAAASTPPSTTPPPLPPASFATRVQGRSGQAKSDSLAAFMCSQPPAGKILCSHRTASPLHAAQQEFK